MTEHHERPPCRERIELPLIRRRGNVIAVEVFTPADRCRQKTPEHWGNADPRAARWLLSGGDPMVLGLCSAARCPLAREPRVDASLEASDPDQR